MSAQRIPEGYVPTLCSRCDSTGKEKTGGKCKGCEGKGFVHAEKPATTCVYCKGTGDEAYNTLCSVCSGSGVAKTWRKR